MCVSEAKNAGAEVRRGKILKTISPFFLLLLLLHSLYLQGVCVCGKGDLGGRWAILSASLVETGDDDCRSWLSCQQLEVTTQSSNILLQVHPLASAYSLLLKAPLHQKGKKKKACLIIISRSFFSRLSLYFSPLAHFHFLLFFLFWASFPLYSI